MITLLQAISIATNNTRAPWLASQLVNTAGAPKPASIRTLVEKVGERRALIFCQVRLLSSLVNVTTSVELNTAWQALLPSAADFQTMLKTLSEALPAGSSIVYVSTDGQTVGISGTINALQSVNGVALTKDQQLKGLEDTAQGLGALAAGEGLMLGAFLAGAAGPIEVLVLVFAGLAFVGAGLILGVGVGQLVNGFCPIKTETVQGDSADDPEPWNQDSPVLGAIPPMAPDIDPNDLNILLNQLLYIELTDIPEPGTLPGAGDLGGNNGGEGGGPGEDPVGGLGA